MLSHYTVGYSTIYNPNCTIVVIPLSSCGDGICTDIFDVSTSPCSNATKILVTISKLGTESVTVVIGVSDEGTKYSRVFYLLILF